MPSFSTDSPLDLKIKKGVIHDTLNILNLSIKRRNRLKNQKKAELQRRLLKGCSLKPQPSFHLEKGEKTAKRTDSRESKQPDLKSSSSTLMLDRELIRPTDKNGKSLKEQMQLSKEHMRRKKRLARERNESRLKGNYELIYPLVSYFEEEKIREKMEQLKDSSHPKDRKC